MGINGDKNSTNIGWLKWHNTHNRLSTLLATQEVHNSMLFSIIYTYTHTYKLILKTLNPGSLILIMLLVSKDLFFKILGETFNFVTSVGQQRWRRSHADTRWSSQPVTDTCTSGGFHRRFFRGAGVKLKEPVGRFLSSNTTPVGFSLNFLTRFFSCHPTFKEGKWGKGTHSGIMKNQSYEFISRKSGASK